MAGDPSATDGRRIDRWVVIRPLRWLARARGSGGLIERVSSASSSSSPPTAPELQSDSPSQRIEEARRRLKATIPPPAEE